MPTPAATAAPAATERATPTPTATSAPAATVEPSSQVAETLDALSSFTSELRSLEAKGDVTRVFVNEAEMARRIRMNFEEEVDREEIERTRRILVLLDLVGPDLDLFKTYTDVYAEQVVGYYSPDDKEMVVIQTADDLSPGDRITYVHEYTHALQDQHFGLSAIDERLEAQGNSDAEAAFAALVEGDATLAMSIYAYTKVAEEDLAQLAGEDGGSLAFDRAPVFLQESVTFPYERGVNFASRLWRQGGWSAIDRAYSELPKSTEQILHFDKYLAGEAPVEVSLEKVSELLADFWEEEDNDTLGEFVLYHVLKTFLQEDRSIEASEGWGGDRYAYYEDVSERQLLVVSTRWDSERDAIQFYEAYVALVGVKSDGAWLQTRVVPAGPTLWDSAEGTVGIQREEDSVNIVLAPDADLAKEVLASLRRSSPAL